MHLHRHHVELLDHVADRAPRLRRGAHQQGIGLGHRRDTHLVAGHFQRHRAVAIAARRQLQAAVTQTTTAAATSAAAETAARRTAIAAVADAAAGHAGAAAQAAVAIAERAAKHAGFRPRRQRRIGIATVAAAAEHFRKTIGQILGLDVLQLVGEQPHAATGTVDTVQPLLDLIQITRLRGDHQHRVGVFQRHETEHAGAGGLALLAEDLFQIGRDFFGLAGLDRKHAHRHARQPVHVEDLHGAQIVFQLGAGAAQGDHIARRIGADDGIRACVRLQHLLHLAGGNELQRHHAHLETACGRWRCGAGRHGAGQRLVGRHDVVAATAEHHAGVVPAQHHFQQIQGLRRRHRIGRGQGHGALHARRDDVVLAEHVAQDRLDHRLQRFAFEIEGGAAAAGHAQRGRRRGRGALVDHGAAAAPDHRTGLGVGIAVGALLGGGPGGAGSTDLRIQARVAAHVRRRSGGATGQQANQQGHGKQARRHAFTHWV